MNREDYMLAREGSKKFDDLLEYYERGKSFTEALMRENERLRLRELQLEQEQMQFRSLIGPERLAQLQEENRVLRTRIAELENRFNEIERENQDFAHRYVEVQSQNDALINLYVSSYQLHSTLDPGEVVNVIVEIILNLIGAEEYFIAMLDDRKQAPLIVVGEGPDGPIHGQVLERMDPILAEVLNEGKEYFASEPAAGSTCLACTPLKVKHHVVGAIVIHKLMAQKMNGFSAIDRELLSLLSDHAATALVSSQLYSRAERKLRTVESFLELLKVEDGAAPARNTNLEGSGP